MKHSEALKSLQARHQALQERERALSDVLRNLKQGYNPNYQDMAVLEAVRGWDGLNPDAVPVEEATEGSEPVPEEEKVVDPWDDNTISTLVREDHISLLLQHDSHVSQEESTEEGTYCPPSNRIDLTSVLDTVFDLESYVPDSLYPAYENARTQMVGLLTKLGVVRETSVSSEGTRSTLC